MSKQDQNLHFSKEIDLSHSPLLEAWLDIRWKLENGSDPTIKEDPGYQFAVGNFHSQIKDKFSHVERLPSSNIPEGLVPNVVRNRFRPGKDQWPLFQLGPGVASVNFTHPYSWNDFRKKALSLRINLLEAYSDYELNPDAFILTFKNGFPYEYSKKDFRKFIYKKLNTKITLPEHIPGFAASKDLITSSKMIFTFDIKKPKGTAEIVIGTGTGAGPTGLPDTMKFDSKQLIILELKFSSGGIDIPDFQNGKTFVSWLDDAHDLIHEWFFAFIEGELLKTYQEEIK